MPYNKDIFRQNLRYLRRQHGFSQEQLAEKFGYKSFVTIQHWESGKAEPPMHVVRDLADLYGVTIDALLEVDMTGGDYTDDGYYLDPEAAMIAQELYERPELKVLFDASRKVSAEDLQIVQAMLDRMVKEEEGDG